MANKICPDFLHPCIKESCIAYIPKLTYPIENIEVMKRLCPGIAINLELIEYPCYLDIDSGFCRKYSDRTDNNNNDLLEELDKITKELNLFDNPVESDIGDVYG